MAEDRCRASLAAIEESESVPIKPSGPVFKEWIVDSRDGYSVPSLSIRRSHPPHLRGTLSLQVRSCNDVQKVSGTQLVDIKISIGALKSKLTPQKLTANHHFEDNSFNFTLAGHEDFLRIRLSAATVLKENCGVAKISIPVLLQMLCPDISPEAARNKKVVASDDSKKAASPSSAADEAKRILSLVESSTLAPHLKAALSSQLREDLAGGEFYEAWFRLGKGDKRSEPCGAILLRMKFAPDWSANASPSPKLTEASSGLSAAEALGR